MVGELSPPGGPRRRLAVGCPCSPEEVKPLAGWAAARFAQDFVAPRCPLPGCIKADLTSARRCSNL